jgi:restriction system protein
MISQKPSEVEANHQIARSRTARLEQDLMAVLSILRSSLRNPPLRWEDLAQETSFDIPQPQKPDDPEKLFKPPYPHPPDPAAFVPPLTFSDKLLRSRGIKKETEAAVRLESAKSAWREKCTEIDNGFNEAAALQDSLHQEKLQKYNTAWSAWEMSRSEHHATQLQQREQFDKLRSDYKTAKAPAVEYFFREVLARSQYPESFPRNSLVHFDESNGVLIVDFELPNQSALPAIKEVKYVATRDQFQEIPLSAAWLKKTYDEVLYQIALRTLRELYSADESHVLKSVAFNGWIQSSDSAPGMDTRACILSVKAACEEFRQINLGQVDPGACFQKLNGIASANLSEPTPIQPILTVNTENTTPVEGSALAG